MTKTPYYFDERYRTLSCHSYADFIQTIAAFQTKNKIDVNLTLRSTPYNIFHENGEVSQLYRWYNLLPILEEKYGIKHDIKRSFCSNQSFYLYVDEEFKLPVVETQPIIEEKVEIDTSSLISLDVAETHENEVVVAEASMEESTSTIPVDWDKCWSFEDDKKKRDSKDNLERFCKKEYGIDLRKNQSFAKMIDELKEFVGA